MPRSLLLFAGLRAAQCSAQLLEFLRIAEQCKQGDNDNEVAGSGYLEFRPSHNKDEARIRRTEYKGHASDKQNNVANERVTKLRQRRAKSMAYPK